MNRAGNVGMNKILTLARWNQLCHQLAIKPDEDEYHQLIAAYSEPQRAYHTLQHLSECLQQLNWMMSKESVNQPIIEIALWYHDAIYQAKHSENEKKSAQWAYDFLTQQGANNKICKQVYSLIMATCHNEVPSNTDQQRIIDIDLSILGADPERFNEYEKQIRKEYNWVPWFLYKYKRKKVLTSFLNRPRIYTSQLFYETYEKHARRNILHSIESLK